MHFIHFVVLGALLAGVLTKEDNELTSEQKNHDSNLRKALLKALTELENDSNGKSNEEQTIEKATASAISIVDAAPTEKTKEIQEQKQIVFIQKSSGVQHKPITSFIPSGFNQTEQILTSASNSYSSNKLENTSPNSINDKLTKIDLSSPTPTVETPTTEEIQAKVEDVQFFSAPLVAAFTVHQDERGLPKSVEPIYKSSSNLLPVVTNYIDDQKYQFQQDFYRQEQLKQEQFRQQLAIQDKQRALEEQLYHLQKQQREQQEFLLKQQLVIRDQERKLLEERERNRLNEKPFVPIQPTHVNHNQIDTVNNFRTGTNQFSTQNPLKPTVVSFQTSVSVDHASLSNGNHLPLNAQQLPVKNFVDFKQSPYQNFNQVQSVLTPPQSTAGHHFNIPNNVNVPQNIRNYRHEPTTGNFINDFGFNRPSFGNVAIQPSVQLSNVRLLRSNVESIQASPGAFPAHQPVVNQQLRNLLYQSGISKGRQEDLNIVSKVLSYNHFGGDGFFNGPRSFSPIHRSDGKV